MNAELEEILAFSQAVKRICPQPQLWNELWETLPNKKRVGAGWEPPLPLILGAWWNTTDLEKKTAFSHIFAGLQIMGRCLKPSLLSNHSHLSSGTMRGSKIAPNSSCAKAAFSNADRSRSKT